MSQERLQEQSSLVCKRLLSLRRVQEDRGICAYLSMKAEWQTEQLLEGLFTERYEAVSDCRAICTSDSRAVFVPKVTGGGRHDMVMLPIINGHEEMDAYPRSKWDIPEPELPSGVSVEEL